MWNLCKCIQTAGSNIHYAWYPLCGEFWSILYQFHLSSICVIWRTRFSLITVLIKRIDNIYRIFYFIILIILCYHVFALCIFHSVWKFKIEKKIVNTWKWFLGGKNKKQELTRIKRFYTTLTMNIENFIPKIAIQIHKPKSHVTTGLF